MSFCPGCGCDIGNAAFCPNCGTKAMVVVRNQAGQAHVSVYETQKDTRMDTIQELSRIYDYFNAKRAWYDEYASLEADIENHKGLANFFIGTNPLLRAVTKLNPKEAFKATPIDYFREKKDAQSRFAELEDALAKYYRDFGYCPIGIEFCNPYVLQRLADIIRSGRADTIKEAINTMFDDAHKSNMEYQAAVTARNSGAAAAFAAATFFLK